MNNLKLFQISTVCLLLINILLILFIFINKPKHLNRLKLDEMAKLDMNLTNDQFNIFINKVEKHKNEMHFYDEQQKKILEQYFQTLSNNMLINKDSLLLNYQKIESQKINITYNHLKEVKSILKKDQLASYQLFLQKALGRIFKKDKNNFPPPKDR